MESSNPVAKAAMGEPVERTWQRFGPGARSPDPLPRTASGNHRDSYVASGLP